MKNQLLIFSLPTLLLMAACHTPAPHDEVKGAPKAVFIILDGIPADVLEKVSTPFLDSIAGTNGYTRAFVGGEKGGYSETPTISAPGYMNLLTATWANKHNVWDNDSQNPNYHYWNIFRIVENHDPELHTAIFSTWLDNRTVLVGEGLPGAGDFRIDYAFDGFELDTVRFPHGNDRLFILQIDEHVSGEAARYIAEKGPDLSWIYLEYTDDVGHETGDGEPFYAAIRQADTQVGKIWEAIKKRQAMGEDWMIVVTTDHGRNSLTGRDHGGQTPRERTIWMVTNALDLNSHFSQKQPAMVDITPSLLHHLGIAPPPAIAREMDGISFLGPVSVGDFKVRLSGDTLTAHWTPVNTDGEATLSVSFSNSFSQGGTDEYAILATVPVKNGKAEIILNGSQLALFERSGILKTIINAPHNQAGCWVVKKEETPVSDNQ